MHDVPQFRAAQPFHRYGLRLPALEIDEQHRPLSQASGPAATAGRRKGAGIGKRGLHHYRRGRAADAGALRVHRLDRGRSPRLKVAAKTAFGTRRLPCASGSNSNISTVTNQDKKYSRRSKLKVVVLLLVEQPGKQEEGVP